jgi:hypothetical protein
MRHIRVIGLLAIVAANAGVAGCGNNPETPTTTYHPVPALTSLTVSGNTSFPGIGQTRPLQLLAAVNRALDKLDDAGLISSISFER